MKNITKSDFIENELSRVSELEAFEGGDQNEVMSKVFAAFQQGYRWQEGACRFHIFGLHCRVLLVMPDDMLARLREEAALVAEEQWSAMKDAERQAAIEVRADQIVHERLDAENRKEEERRLKLRDAAMQQAEREIGGVTNE